jgi:hypothetical protein
MVREYNQRKEQTSANQSDDENSDDSTSSLTIYERAYACFRPEPGESNAESAERHRLIEERVTELKQARRRKIKLPPSTKHHQQLETTNEQQRRKTVRTKKDIKKQLKRPPIESSTTSLRNNTQSYTFKEVVTQTPDTRRITRQINVIVDTGATFTMLPGDYDFAWTNRSPCLHIIEGCFKGGGTNKDTAEMGEMHALITLDNGEVRRTIIPQAIALPPGMANSYLLAITPFLIADHKYTCRLDRPKLHFKGGGTYTIDVIKGHHILNITPIHALTPTHTKRSSSTDENHTTSPTFHNHSTMTQNTNRPKTKTPTAFIYHLRFACASEVVLKRTQGHVFGMEVQLGSWDKLKDNLPCSACLAGKMRKTRKAQSSAFTPVQNLALSWTLNTDSKMTIPNKNISTDWGIIHKTSKAGQNTVFALYLDLNTGWVAAYPKLSRGLAGETLQEYCQAYGLPETILHDNATEYLHGDFATICKEKGIKQVFSAPHHPNQNPTEHYMDIIMSKAKCLLYISGLDPAEHW